MRRVLPLLLLLLLAAPACGNDVGDASRDPYATEADEEAVAKASTLQSEDAPKGWKLTPSEGGPDMLGECRGFDDSAGFSSARADAPDFDSTDETFSVLDTVYLYPDEITAKNAFSGMRAADVAGCLGDEMDRFFEANQVSVKVGEPAGKPLEVTALGDQIDGERITIPIDDGTEPTSITADVVILRGGRGISFLVFIGFGAPFDDPLRAELTKTGAQRLTTNAS